jgi:RND family efflux transporter MFP subunit
MPPAPVVAAQIVKRSVADEQTFVGTVEPLHTATIGSAVSDRVMRVLVEEGDRVEADQTLVQLLTDTIELEIAGAEAELVLRREQLAELENGSRPEEIAQVKARMDAAAAREDFLNARFARMKSLLSSRGAVTEEEVEEAQSQAIESQQNHLEMKAAHELVVEGPRQETVAQARAQVAIQEAMVQRLQDQMRKHTIVSRFPGYVIAKLTEEGQWVSPGDAVAQIAALDEVDVIAQVVERYVAFVRAGSEVKIEIPAIPNHPFVGKVITTVPQGDVRARTFPVKIRVRNEITLDGPLIKSGMLARATLPVGDKQEAVLVPKDAIVLGGAKPLVMVIAGAQSAGQTGTPQPVPVELGIASGQWIQVTGAVEVGQLVVVQGNERLRPGQQVSITSVVEPE